MIIKFIGAVLILCGCGLLGIISASSYRKEVHALGGFIELIHLIECELQYKANKLQNIFEDLAGSTKSPISDFCHLLSVELDSQVQPCVPDCIYAALSKCRNIPRSTEKFILDMGQTLGRFDLKGQLSELSAVKKEAESVLSKLKAEQDFKTRNIKTLAICAGAAIVILFI